MEMNEERGKTTRRLFAGKVAEGDGVGGVDENRSQMEIALDKWLGRDVRNAVEFGRHGDEGGERMVGRGNRVPRLAGVFRENCNSS